MFKSSRDFLMPISHVEPDIGRFSRSTILTGAGWTRNWGGRLAEELWQDLMGHRAVQNNDRLRSLLIGERSFLFEQEYLSRKLREFGGNVTRTATAIGLERQSLQEIIKKLGVLRP
jgi:DNA-binding NtrC family response regulator